jgi:CHRD domain-containing protein
MRALAFAIVVAFASIGCTPTSTGAPPATSPGSGATQPPHGGRMHSGGPVLFLGRADGGQVVPHQASGATATAAIIIDRVAQELSYDVTYQGLERGPPSRIALYNFGIGGNGAVVTVLCGPGAEACPPRPAARLAGMATGLRLPGRLLVEFASGRVYLQIDGGDGRPEIRGQLDANDAMVGHREFVARLAPGPARGAAGEGTAILTETYLPGNRVAVEYSVTVAGTTGTPNAVALVGLAAPADVTAARFTRSGRLLNVRRAVRARAGGGSFNGSYISSGRDRSPVVNRLIAEARTPAVVVRTSRFPNGELAGVFVPVE